MKSSDLFCIVLTALLLLNCGAPKNSGSPSAEINKELTEKNRTSVSLLQRISQLRGVVLYNNVPVINKTANSISAGGTQEPLYVLNNQIIGNSFRSVNEVVDSYNVKEIKVLTGADASSYGSQGGNGVIKITTY